ncbi:hypothetical protein [Gordonia crocea]|uniref:Uncharacterized protein n=1 Tax=Gordonia crocea TaxID=589162 RepID=A0A7I9UVL7_9ACTN|nr:hypothetical protein [Gordonia crocea]GED97185.1 hypothetical protein nbrc107697_12240 [Gordonia crocea]
MLAVAAPQTGAVLRTVRGLTVGSLAAFLALGGHLAAMPSDTPGIGLLTLLVLGCAGGGAAAGGHRARSWQLGALLAAAQVLGHLTLTIGAAHPMGLPSPTMIGAHAVALAVGMVVVEAAERAAAHALGLLHALHRTDSPGPAPAPRPWAVVCSDSPLVATLDAVARPIRRGPPALAAVSP